MSAEPAAQSASTTARAYANPYVGLRPFMREDSRLFFGRREQSVALLALLRESRFLPVVGSSGSGKSSLVRAGLVPALLGGFLVQDRDQWLIATMKPGDAPLANLARALLAGAGERGSSADELAKRIEADPFEAVSQEIAARVGERSNLLLVVDQFEELFAFRGDAEVASQAATRTDDRGPGWSQRRAEADDFVALLLELAEANELPVYVVLTMRSDFAGDCDLFRGLPEAMNRTRYLVPRLRREQLREAIEGPARLEGVTLAPRLLDRLLNEMGDRSDQLPIMQHALLQTWEQWRTGVGAANGAGSAAPVIEQQHYEAAGTLATALSKDADQALAQVEPRLAELLFKRLTDTDLRGRRVRRATSCGDLRELAEASGFSEQDVERVLTTFQAEGRHFVDVTDADSRDERRIDISHESLIRQWPTLRDWVDQERAARDEYLTLIAQHARHQRSGQSKPTLLQEADLAVAEQWRAQPARNATWARRYAAPGEYEAVVAYIEISKRERTRVQRARNRTVIAVGAVLLVLTLAAAAFGVYAWQQSQTAERAVVLAKDERAKAERALARNLFEEAQQALAGGDTRRAASELAESYRLAPDEQRVRLLLPHVIALSTGLKGTVLKAGTEEVVNRARFSPDGTRVVTASDDNRARIWEISSGRLLAELSGHDDVVNDASFSANGELVLTASSDHTARIWDARTGKPVGAPLDAQGTIMTAALYGADAHIFAVAADYSARVWTLARGAHAAAVAAPASVRLEGYPGPINQATFSADGARVVTTEDDYVRIWDARRGVERIELRAPTRQLFTQLAVLSPDGTRIAASTQDKVSASGVSAGQNPIPATVGLWNAVTGKLEHTLAGHDDAVSTLAFSSDGALVVSASNDRTARVWDAQGNLLAVLQGHDDQVLGASFSPDGERIATVSRDESARLWYARTGHLIAVLPGHRDSVIGASFSADGKYVVTASNDGSARLWNSGASLASAILRGHEGEVNAASFSPDGRLVLTASVDKTARLWDAASGALRAKLSHQDAVNSARFSPDGARVVTASADLSAVIWDVQNGRLLVRVHHDAPVTDASFSPNGTRILTASEDRSAVVWDAASGKPLRVLNVGSTALAATFSPDGKRVLIRTDADPDVDPEKTANVWDALSGKRVSKRLGEDVAAAAFSPDGKTIATGAYEKTTFWDAPDWQARPKQDDGEVTALSFDPSGSRLAVAKGTWVRILEVQSLEPKVQLKGHRARINVVGFSPDGSWIVTASDDLTTRVWDATTGRVLLTFQGHQKPINTASFNRDGSRLVTASDDHTARIWSTALETRSPEQVKQLIASDPNPPSQ
jgi:WD40 repeat protein